MKKLIIALMLFIISLNSFSQLLNRNIIKVSPIVIMKGQIIEVHFERALFNSLSLSIGVAPIFIGEFFDEDYLDTTIKRSLKGIAIDPEIRWYSRTNNALDGYFIGIFNSQRMSGIDNHNGPLIPNKENDPFSSVTYNSIDPTYISKDKYNVKKKVSIYGFQLGYERVFNNMFVFDFYSGLGIGNRKYTSINNRTNYKVVTNGIKFHCRFNFSFGYKF